MSDTYFSQCVGIGSLSSSASSLGREGKTSSLSLSLPKLFIFKACIVILGDEKWLF